ncbi:3-methyl-2-oxobutanoate hydroxymethyltransferase [Meiothermus sp. QL-1]|uniref:3-methyl-2-oxobutanoate hydroxymethyltransferase n=1 Tax=Meiothermus sp. QL-1 TaxID=2058095 RepID=UPI000E0A14DB|nr:3-methyl-2-oxobutanoate hydroxymethyltransferase [Meiothermus sp. QL-1]
MVRVTDFAEAKRRGRKLKMLTAYDYPTARILDAAGIDAILVGDSLGMVVLGYEDTTRVTLEDMLHHTRAVVRGARRAMVIADMPFLSYHLGVYESVRAAGRLVQEGGCKAVKLEGGMEVLRSVRAIRAAGIPVMGHLGYTPQSVHLFGGHRAQGRTLESARQIVRSALALQEAGVFALVLELVPHRLATWLSQRLDIPTIGIGSGPGCDGQVLVTQDMLGLFPDFNPRHVRKYQDLHGLCLEAVRNYARDVESGAFPTAEHSFSLDEGVLEALEKEF